VRFRRVLVFSSSLDSSTLTKLQRKLLVAALGLGLSAAQPAFAQRPLPPGAAGPLVGMAEVFHVDETTGLALGGFDPVTYLLPEGPQPGRSPHELVWSGVAWRFASAANRAAFEASPTVYAPRLGGYDAEAMSRGMIVDANPAISVIREGRLYLFRNDANRARFLADPTVAPRAEERWAGLRTGLVQP
jgi:YHS domain-containing protein